MSIVNRAFRRPSLDQIVSIGLLSMLAIVNMFPFYWAALTAFKHPQDILALPPKFFTLNLTLANFQRILTDRFDIFYMNSIIQVILAVTGTLFFASLGGFIFAKFSFWGKEALFKAILATMMVPAAVTLIPRVVVAGRLGLIDNMAGLVVPFLVPQFGIYLMRQFMETIPNELLDAACIDGASTSLVFFRIMLPLSQPALSTLAIFFFLGNWNRYLWPLVTTYSKTKWTLPVGAAQYTTQYVMEYGPSCAAAALMMAPLALVFLFFQRGITEGIALTGIKG